MNQDDIFFASEGDQYYKRNMENHSNKFDEPLKMLHYANLNFSSVLEIGCADGWRLMEIQKAFHANCVGIEPSEEAVKSGSKLYPNIKLIRATAAEIPLKISFDLVIVNFVLHWIDRKNLIKSISEIDRVTGKYLLIGDFYANEPVKRQYHHLPKEDVYTYKQNYAHIFTNTAIYKQIACNIYPFYTTINGKKIPDKGTSGVCTLLEKGTFYKEESPTECSNPHLPKDCDQ